jgi:hypothetical protein
MPSSCYRFYSTLNYLIENNTFPSTSAKQYITTGPIQQRNVGADKFFSILSNRREFSMFNSGILDVAIGLIFVYSLLSLVCTAINEMIEARLKMRATDLEKGIREMLHDQSDTGLVQKLYNHPLIYSLFEGGYDNAKKTRKLPSYIPSRNFALALMELVLPAKPSDTGTPAETSGVTGATVQTSNSLQPLRDAISRWSDEKTRQVLMTLLDTVEDKSSNASDTSASADTPIMALRDAIGKTIQDKNVRQALMTLVDAAGNDIGQARKNIEDWFDSSMDRVSGWYKRRVQWITLFVGLVIAVAVNADTLAIGNSLSYDVSMRDALVAATQEYAKADSTQSISQNAQAQMEACRKDENSPECRVAKNLNEIQKLGLPMGWNMDDPTTFPNTLGGWLAKGLGWLLTAFAISLGSPFWFDLLNKIMIVRSTVRPKEKSPEEPPVNR